MRAARRNDQLVADIVLAAVVRVLEHAAQFVGTRSWAVLDDLSQGEVEGVLAIAGAAARGHL